MTTVVYAQIAPQRSTQYADLATALAPHELRLSPLGALALAITPENMGGQAYLRCELSGPADETCVRELGALAMTSAYFEGYDRIGDLTGPFLKPIDTGFTPAFPPDLMATRRYRGKTNETFTHFMCNLARFSSAFAAQPWGALRVFDPLMGGGTTLLAALVLGADAMGVEEGKEDVVSTATFVAQYAREQRIVCEEREERLKKYGRRWWFELTPPAGDGRRRQCILARGETAQSIELLHGAKRPHLIVTDLPYGIQHRGELVDLLTAALPIWSAFMQPGGAMVLAWDSTRLPRADMIALAHAAGPLRALNHPPYDQMAHRVDRVIKQRDVLVLTGAGEKEQASRNEAAA
jgi:hypothetical protein